MHTQIVLCRKRPHHRLYAVMHHSLRLAVGAKHDARRWHAS